MASQVVLLKNILEVLPKALHLPFPYVLFPCFVCSDKRCRYIHRRDAQDVCLVRHLHGLGVAYFIGDQLFYLRVCKHT